MFIIFILDLWLWLQRKNGDFREWVEEKKEIEYSPKLSEVTGSHKKTRAFFSRMSKCPCSHSLTSCFDVPWIDLRVVHIQNPHAAVLSEVSLVAITLNTHVLPATARDAPGERPNLR